MLICPYIAAKCTGVSPYWNKIVPMLMINKAIDFPRLVFVKLGLVKNNVPNLSLFQINEQLTCPAQQSTFELYVIAYKIIAIILIQQQL